jgi:uncharacterized protein YjgD (DUF1641 family)
MKPTFSRVALATTLVFSLNLHSAKGIILQDDENIQSGTVESSKIGISIVGDGSAPMVFSAVGSSVDGGPMVLSFGSPMEGGALALPLLANSPALMTGPQAALSLLNDPDIQKEIEMASDQLKEYQEMQQSLQQAIEQRMGDLTSGNFDPKNAREIGEVVRKMREEHQTRIERLLLPHQFQRLQQISLQRHIQQNGAVGALGNKQLMEELGLTEEQLERLKKRSGEINDQLKIKMEKLKEEAQAELLAELNPQQRNRFLELIGKKYEFKTPTRNLDPLNRLRTRQDAPVEGTDR